MLTRNVCTQRLLPQVITTIKKLFIQFFNLLFERKFISFYRECEEIQHTTKRYSLRSLIRATARNTIAYSC